MVSWGWRGGVALCVLIIADAHVCERAVSFLSYASLTSGLTFLYLHHYFLGSQRHTHTRTHTLSHAQLKNSGGYDAQLT